MSRKKNDRFPAVLSTKKAAATARMKGGSDAPRLRGTVNFYRLKEGIAVTAECTGIPVTAGNCVSRIHGFHIHNGSCCCGTAENPFAEADGHLNPEACPHPAHAGDMPPLFATTRGQAWGAFLSDRFTLGEILGKTIILHADVDDFTSQPSGNAGMMLACGVIKPVK